MIFESRIMIFNKIACLLSKALLVLCCCGGCCEFHLMATPESGMNPEDRPPQCLDIPVSKKVLVKLPESVRPTELAVRVGTSVDFSSIFSAITGLNFSQLQLYKINSEIEEIMTLVRRKSSLNETVKNAEKYMKKNPKTKHVTNLMNECLNECKTIEAQLKKFDDKKVDKILQDFNKVKENSVSCTDYTKHCLPDWNDIKNHWALGLLAKWNKEAVSQWWKSESLSGVSVKAQVQEGGREIAAEVGAKFDENLWSVSERYKKFCPTETAIAVGATIPTANLLLPIPQTLEARVGAAWDGKLLPKKIDDAVKPEVRIIGGLSTVIGLFGKMSVQFKRFVIPLLKKVPQIALEFNGAEGLQLHIGFAAESCSDDDGHNGMILQSFTVRKAS
jgi:hypothetical protein